jgi:hypothetical protein
MAECSNEGLCGLITCSVGELAGFASIKSDGMQKRHQCLDQGASLMDRERDMWRKMDSHSRH